MDVGGGHWRADAGVGYLNPHGVGEGVDGDQGRPSAKAAIGRRLIDAVQRGPVLQDGGVGGGSGGGKRHSGE